MKLKTIIILIVVVCLFFALVGSCSDNGHAPGYGNTSKCTICGKPATHKTSNYGFCNVHWDKATGN